MSPKVKDRLIMSAIILAPFVFLAVMLTVYLSWPGVHFVWDD